MSDQTAPKPVTDLSQMVVSLARQIDRLPPGRYMVALTKPDYRGQEWSAEIVQVEPIRTMLLQPRDV